VLSFPFPDGEGWTTARLQVPPRDRGAHAEEEEREGSFRIALGIELSALGPVRADLALAPGVLAVRLVVTREEALALVEDELAELRARLGDGRRGVVPARAPRDTRGSLRRRAMDIAFLRENRLMSVDG
jgi:hypothetical protein